MERFDIRRKISDTLLGAVYECQLRHSQRRSSVALKCSSLVVADDLRTRSQSRRVDDPRREWQVVEQLIASGGHRHVVQCYDQFVSAALSTHPAAEEQSDEASPRTEHEPTQERDNNETMIVLISEYCRGGDLHSFLESSPGGHVTERQALQFMLQITRGVQFLHGLGFAHRDLSLENVLLRNGVCKIADFALACRVDERSDECVGKDLYMAPEVVAVGESVGVGEVTEYDPVKADVWSMGVMLFVTEYDPVKADVWSMGVMLFVLLTGSRLVVQAAPHDKSFLVVQSHGASALLTAWGLSSQLSSSTLRVLDSMLQVDPMRRSSVLGVLRALEQIA
ncbi:hypothetical protein ATCC90586_000413 [Pythium insidiosum]|nr:hypothetical protein ATCC90586_000413 [Pythium insidiosum]